jgi:SAM-dependent methyltransferase
MVGQFQEPGVITTRNRRGHTSTVLNEYSRMFVNFVPRCAAPVLDIGCAFGVATLPALEAGGTVVACDMEDAHLRELLARCPEGRRRSLVAVRAQFPGGGISFPDGSFDAIHASNLLNYLTGDELVEGVARMHDWLRPGGRVFTISGTPYARNVTEFIPIYEAKRANGATWPGEAYGLADLCPHPSVRDLPPFLHLLDDAVLTRVFTGAGFEIERVEMFQRRNLPEYIALDGRENVGLVARRR